MGGGAGGHAAVNANALSASAAAAVLARSEKKAPSFCDAVRKFLRQYTAAMVAAQKARMEAQAAGKKGKKKGGGKKSAAGGKKKKEPPVEFEPWLNFLEELLRKSTSGSIKVEARAVPVAPPSHARRARTMYSLARPEASRTTKQKRARVFVSW